MESWANVLVPEANVKGEKREKRHQKGHRMLDKEGLEKKLSEGL